MRTLVIISLLSLIGVIKCRPQQQLGQDIPVQASISYKSPTQYHTPNTTFRQKVVRKNSSQNLRNSTNSSITHTNDPRVTITSPRTAENSSRVAKISLGSTNVAPRRNRATIFPKDTAQTNHNWSRSSSTKVPEHQILTLLDPNPQKVEQSPSSTKPKEIQLPKVIVPSSFPVFSNNTPRGRPRFAILSQEKQLKSQDETKTGSSRQKSLRADNLELARPSLRGSYSKKAPLEHQSTRSPKVDGVDQKEAIPVVKRRQLTPSEAVNPKSGGPNSYNLKQAEIDLGSREKSSGTTLLESRESFLNGTDFERLLLDYIQRRRASNLGGNEQKGEHHGTKRGPPGVGDLQFQSTNWFNNLTSFFKTKMLQFAQNRTQNLDSSRFLSGISLPNASNDSPEDFQRSEDSKKRLRWRIFKSLLQRKLEPVENNAKITSSRVALPINITEKIIRPEEDLKVSKNFSRKAPVRVQKPPGKDDVFNLRFNITKLAENQYKVSSKNNPKNVTKSNLHRPKPLVRPYFTEETKKPFQDSQNKWFQLKLKNPSSQEGTEKNYDFSTLPSIYVANSVGPSHPSIHGVTISNHIPQRRPEYGPYYPLTTNTQPSPDVFGQISPEISGYNSVNEANVENLEDFQGNLPVISNTISTQNINGANSLVISSSLTTPSPNGFSPNIGNTITLSPEVVSISQGTHTLAGPEFPCTNLHIQSNVYNKQACQDLDITINNHISTENNYFDEEENGFQEGQEDYEEEDYEEDSDEVTESAIITDEEYEDELAQEAVVQEPVVADPLAAESTVAENPVQAAASTGTNPGGSSGGLLNRPTFPRPGTGLRPGGGSSEEDDDGGLFGSGGLFSWFTGFNLFNFPLFGLLAAPLTIMLTSALGVSTLFLPWTVLPTLFLGRKAKQRSSFAQFSRPIVSRPDGWFWHNKYKTWVNLNPQRNSRAYEDWGTLILDLIEDFGRRYVENYGQSWKRRKKD